MKLNIKRDLMVLKDYVLLKNCNYSINNHEIGLIIEDYKEKDFGEFTESINKFYNNLLNINNINRSAFLHNIKTLDISYDICKSKTKVKGYYSPFANKIRFLEKFDRSIYHELFHLSSSYKCDDSYYVGFSLFSDNKDIGYGINEGYTQHLTLNYFPDKVVDYAYEYEVICAEALDEIVGKNNMEQLYFNADQYGLIKTLSFYQTEKNIVNFIKNTDFISKINIIEPSYTEYRLVLKSMKEVNKFLIETYLKKINILIDTNLIDHNAINDKIVKFIKLVGIELLVDDEIQYCLIKNDEIKTYLYDNIYDYNSKNLLIPSLNNGLQKKKLFQ